MIFLIPINYNTGNKQAKEDIHSFNKELLNQCILKKLNIVKIINILNIT